MLELALQSALTALDAGHFEQITPCGRGLIMRLPMANLEALMWVNSAFALNLFSGSWMLEEK